MRLILLGPSGAGKGTLGAFIERDYSIPHISTGQLFRDNVEGETELGKQVKQYINDGVWVPDEITMEMVRVRLEESDARCGFILDGIPRTLKQAEVLATKVEVDLVIEIDIDDEVVVERLLGRYVCPKCKTNHSTQLGPVEKCIKCETKLVHRTDDEEEAIRNRLRQYRESVAVLRKFYGGILFTIKVEKGERPRIVYEKVKTYFEKVGIKPSC